MHLAAWNYLLLLLILNYFRETFHENRTSMAIFAKTSAKIIMFMDDFPANEISQNLADTSEISHNLENRRRKKLTFNPSCRPKDRRVKNGEKGR
jgi:hypothetical protein